MNSAIIRHSPLEDTELVRRIQSLRLLLFDFDGVFTDNLVYVAQDGTEMVRCTRADGLGLQKVKRLGIEMAVVSTEANPVVGARCRKLGLRFAQGVEDKRDALNALCEEAGVSFAEVAFVGNDINDLPCLTAVGLPIVVADAHPEVLKFAKYQTRAPGGHGAVREVCDLIADAFLVNEANG
jgi:3-deoxy-D-manno-octulosonate 8-phosphate phosphatase (KDO 8-P phosphatase)